MDRFYVQVGGVVHEFVYDEGTDRYDMNYEFSEGFTCGEGISGMFSSDGETFTDCVTIKSECT